MNRDQPDDGWERWIAVNRQTDTEVRKPYFSLNQTVAQKSSVAKGHSSLT